MDKNMIIIITLILVGACYFWYQNGFRNGHKHALDTVREIK